jgi:ribosomal protein S18 acetylase RimI-like enzyme
MPGWVPNHLILAWFGNRHVIGRWRWLPFRRVVEDLPRSEDEVHDDGWAATAGGALGGTSVSTPGGGSAHGTGGASASAVLELERIAARGWPGTETVEIGGWLLRAGNGWTGRANSALPLRPVAPDALDGHLDEVAAWYAARDLPPLVQVPLPTREHLRAALVVRGWVDRWGAVVLTAPIATVLDAVDGHGPGEVVIDDEPTPAWLAAYHYRGGALPATAVAVLRAGTMPRFLSIVDDGATVAVARTAVADGWVGITAVEVDARHRRRGLARRLLVAALDHARTVGATAAYLQTEETNDAALRLYTSAGFTGHHRYRYHGPLSD